MFALSEERYVLLVGTQDWEGFANRKRHAQSHCTIVRCKMDSIERKIGFLRVQEYIELTQVRDICRTY